jgi:hypothetical protein
MTGTKDTALIGDADMESRLAIFPALRSAFWDAYLRSDAAAIDWLNGDGPRSVLESRDRWQMK